MPTPDLPRALAGGLVLHRATAADADRLAEFNGQTHEQPYDTVAAVWTRDLLRGDHPTGAHDHVLIVEDTATGAIVSTSCLIPQTWSYAGIPLRAGRPELIGTAPAYRNRGLVREQFRVLHAWVEVDRQDLQFITGIPYYYRQFGYEPALSVGGLVAQAVDLPTPAEPTAKQYRTRVASPDDIPTIARFADQSAARTLVNTDRNDVLWRYELFGRDPGSDYAHTVELVETQDGTAVGFTAYLSQRHGGQLEVTRCEVAPGESWRTIGSVLLHRLQAIGESQVESSDPFTAISLIGDANHPITAAFPNLFVPRPRDFFFYIRLPDLARFLRLVAPELERRVATSVLVGYDGTLRLNLYRSGLALTFTNGQLTEITPWRASTDDLGDARFPDLTVYQLILGTRSLPDLEYAFADCRVATDDARALLTVLFPTIPSAPWPVG